MRLSDISFYNLYIIFPTTPMLNDVLFSKIRFVKQLIYKLQVRKVGLCCKEGEVGKILCVTLTRVKRFLSASRVTQLHFVRVTISLGRQSGTLQPCYSNS